MPGGRFFDSVVSVDTGARSCCVQVVTFCFYQMFALTACDSRATVPRTIRAALVVGATCNVCLQPMLMLVIYTLSGRMQVTYIERWDAGYFGVCSIFIGAMTRDFSDKKT